MCFCIFRETREYLSQQEIDKKDEYEAKKKTRADARVKLINTIEQLEKDTSTNGIVQLKNLKVASSKLNAVQLMISNLQQDNPTDVKTRSRLEKDAAMYEQKLYDELLKLDLNTDGKDWEFGGDIDKVALEFVTQHKRLGSVRHRINKIKEDATLSNAHENIKYELLDLINHIAGLEGELMENSKWANKEKKMTEILDTINGMILVL